MGHFHFHESEEESSISRWQKWFRGENTWKRICIGLGFLLSLALVLHFKEVQVEVLELNTPAKHYVIGQIDFDFPDVEAMTLLKQEEVRDISTIYQVNKKQIRERAKMFADYLVQDQAWRENSEFYTFDELYRGGEMIENALEKYRFTNSRTLQKMKDLNISTDFYFSFTPKENQTNLFFPKDFWRNFQKTVFANAEFQSGISDFVIDFFQDQTWGLQEDLARQIELRQIVEESIPQKYTRLEAGRRIIDAGEKVLPRHIAILNAMKSALTKARNSWDPLTILGSIMIATLLTILVGGYLRVYHRDIFYSLQKITLLVTILLLTLAFAKGTEYLILHPASFLIDIVRYPIFVPFAVLLISVLIGREIALLTLAFLLVTMSISLAFNDAHFLSINLTAGLLAILFAKKMHKRRDVFLVCAKIWLYSLPVILAFTLIENHTWNFHIFLTFASTFICLLATAIGIVVLLPIIESCFDLMTDMRLIEYLDPNNELLQRMSLELPGTYQHCLVVSNIAEAASAAIGANALFCRVSALYHDIGKLLNPHYFTENQLGGFNIHQLLTPLESAQVIIAHVRDGEVLARKHHLPQSFIDIIREHHGTTVVYYFYHKQTQQSHKVDPALFRYPGPKPKTKESIIVMLADSVEAASRSLEEPSEEAVCKMVDCIVAEKASEGQFDECQLTFEELGIVKKNIVRSLVLAQHLRVKYPQRSLIAAVNS